MKDYEKLLLSGEEIVNRHDILEKSKEKYNVFEALQIERNEVNLHSRFIYNLINPKEKNSLNKEFFKDFIEMVLEEKYDPIGKYLVFREYSTPDGRLDLYIMEKNQNFGYAIEMKIDAKDQEDQLKKYEVFLKDQHNEKYRLFYLTLDGREASELGADEDTEYKTISFKENISSWLEKCLEKSQDFPMMRETIRQYLDTVNKISENMEDEKEMELKELLLKGKNLRTAEEMSKIIEEIKSDIEENFWKELREKIKNRFGIQDNLPIFDKDPVIFYENNCIYFYKDISSNNKILSYGLCRDDGDGKIYIFIGIEEKISENWKFVTKNVIEQDSKIEEKLKKICNEIYEKKTQSWNWEYLSNEFDFNSEDFYILVEKERAVEREKLIEDIVQEFALKYTLIEKLF